MLGCKMGVAELMYQHSLHLSEEEAKQALAFVQFLEQRSLATQQDNSVARPWKVGLIGITPDEFHQEIKNSFLNPLMPNC